MKHQKIEHQSMIHKTSLVAALFIAQLTTTQLVYAQIYPKTQLFEGVIGTAPIVMELTVNADRRVSGRYFYQKHILDIALDGKKLSNGRIQLGENLNNSDGQQNPIVNMLLRPDHGGFQGEWSGHDAKSSKQIAIKLRPLLIKAVQNTYSLPSDSTEYDQIRLNNLMLRPQKRTRFGHYNLQWWQEPVSKVSFFRVLNGYPAETLAQINTVLTDHQWQEVNRYFSCQLGGARSSGGDYDVIVTPRLMNDKLFSTSVESSYYCGGAHPDFGDTPINLDVKTGQSLQLEDVLWLDKTKPMILKRNANGIRDNLDYETKILGFWINQTMIKLYPKKVAPHNKLEQACDYRDPELWLFPAFYFTPKGLHLAAYFPRVSRVCDNPDWAIVPWKIVNQHQGVLGVVLR